ncbi:MAG: DUF1822 family protein [Scytonematopsis contorta HA4267-MV1]|jgi:hypothetical protein|nr:DUF1822 family protein [Scytonematopsis contorta HA4267-MV1]
MFDSHQLERATFNQLRLEVSAAEKQLAWQESEKHFSTLSRYNAYLNSLCLHSFLHYLQQWFDEESTYHPIVPNKENLPSIWGLINGTAILLSPKRIILIPKETINLEELCVPQEWVDIPKFAGDYYLAIQVHLGMDDESWLEVCGFTTHRQLKYEGQYNEKDRTYSIAVEKLVVNLTVMEVMQELEMRAEIAGIPVLPEAEAQELLQLLGNPSIYSPRLQVNVPFEKWASLLENDKWRQQLYQQRVGSSVISRNATPVTNLLNWLQNNFEAGWESVSTILNTESKNFAFAFRQRDTHVTGIFVERIKLIDLGMQLGNQSVALLLALTQEQEQKVGIKVQLHPAKGQIYLPKNVRLTLISSSGTVIQELESRSQDNFIQLPRFTCPTGKRFSIQVAINDFSITEGFAIEPQSL